MAATSSVVTLQLQLEGMSFVDGGSTSDVNFPVGSGQSGELKRWVTTTGGVPRVIIDSSLESGLSVNVIQAPGDRLEQWLSHCVDNFAVDVLALTDPKTTRNNVFDLRCALLQQKIEAVLSSTSSVDLGARLKFLSEQLTALKKGQLVNVGKLSDMRFGSQFVSATASSSAPRVAAVHSVTAAPQIPLISNKPEHVERNVRYTQTKFGLV